MMVVMVMDKNSITKEQFIREYLSESGMTRDYFNDEFTVVPCQCGHPNCFGWSLVNYEDLFYNMELDDCFISINNFH